LARNEDDVTDATVAWPETRELVEFGTITLTERLDELAPEWRKVIFDPVPRLDGIDSSGDPLIEVRSEIYLQSGRRRGAGGGNRFHRPADVVWSLRRDKKANRAEARILV